MNPLMLQHKRNKNFLLVVPALMINFSSSNVYVVEHFWDETKANAGNVDKKMEQD